MIEKQERHLSTLSNDLKREFTNFLQTFQVITTHGQKQEKYMRLIKEMLESDRSLLIINHQDLITYNSDLAHMIFQEYYKYQTDLNNALTNLARQCQKNIMSGEQLAKKDQQKDKFQIAFDSALNSNDQASVRDLKCDKLGKMTCFRGTITRTTQVRPQILIAIFKCKNCGTLSKPIPQQFKYTQPKRCIGKNCNESKWEIILPQSQFADFQKLRVQQDPTKIPPGAMPRSIDVVIRNEMVQKGQPGDKCKFVGYLCVLPQLSSMLKPGQKTTLSTRNTDTRGQQMMEMQGVTGLKGIRQLNYKLIFISTNLIVQNNQFRQQEQIQTEEVLENEKNEKQDFNQDMIISKIFNRLSEQEIFLIRQMKQNSNLYQDMANSLFPSVFGHIQIKKALLLQLFGGIHKITKNKINIRGDINILIVGDPSTAKSQFLKIVNKFVPRSVYTNGKTTSAAGLTASVSRDQSGNMGIQAGALMLADNGICCIDQFDKMNLNDQVAIHQAMQQQTISIAKAGVYATLNARTSILAAANPIFGRYDKSKSLKNNLNLSAPIMSRFDLFFIVCDEANQSSDFHLSDFIINMHKNKDAVQEKKYDNKSLKLYISTAKKLKPKMNIDAARLLAKFYKELRQKDRIIQNNSYKVTVRQLESMIRISEALARLNLDTQVKGQYVKQAFALISSSIIKLQKSPIDLIDQQIEEQVLKNNKHIVQEAINKELEMKKEEKKNKQISISHQLYQQIMHNVVDLFKKQQQIQQKSEDQITINQQQLVVYLLGVNFESGIVTSQEESLQMKKIINAVIKKLIKQERVLMVVDDHPQNAKRVLRIHPNYQFD